jgi:uncharacterized protein (DUF427 family)
MNNRALPVKPGQQSVWQYPRPAVAQPVHKDLRVEFAGQVIASTHAGFCTLETSHPPSYYIPRSDVRMEFLRATARTSVCEWKGHAVYFDVVVGDQVALQAAWSYPTPTAPFACLQGCLAFYPAAMDGCFVGDERVVAQPGNFYGGWITADIVGPFKGVAGSDGW